METFGEILRSIRIDKGLHQGDLVAPGLPRPAIVQMESGKRTPTYEQLLVLSEKLDVPVTVFFEGVVNPSVQKAIATLMQQALRAEHKERWEEAYACWESMLDLSQSYRMTSYALEARWHVALSLEHLGRAPEALEAYLALLAEGWGASNADMRMNLFTHLGSTLRLVGQWEESNIFFKLALQLLAADDPKRGTVHLNLGSGYLLLNRWDDAQAHYTAAHTHATEHGLDLLEAWSLIGLASIQLNQGEASAEIDAWLRRAEHIAYVERVEELQTAVLHNQIALYRLRGDGSRARRLWEKYASLAPATKEAFIERLIEQCQLAAACADDALGEEALSLAATATVPLALQSRLWQAIAAYALSKEDPLRAEEALLRASDTFPDTAPQAHALFELWKQLSHLLLPKGGETS